MNILAANKFYYIKGGAERFYFDLNKLLEEKGNKVIPFSMQDDQNVKSEYSKYFVSKIDIEKTGFSMSDIKAAGRIIYSLEAKKNIKKLLDAEKIDIAHIHNIYHQISPSILTELKKHKIPIVMSVHDYKLMCPNYLFYTEGAPCTRCKKYKYYNAVIHKCVKNSRMASKVNMLEMYLHRLLKIYKNNIDLYICPSQFVADKLIEFGFNKDKVVVMPHFSDIDNIQPSYSDDDYIFNFGRISKEKGVGLLIDAVKDLKDVKLKIAGHGPQEEELKKYVKDNSISNVEFVGYLSGDDLKRAIDKSFFTVQPSRVYETFGLTVLESFAHGKPVIGSNIGAIPELLRDGTNGYLFESENVDDLREKINLMYSNKESARTMGKQAREFIEGTYGKDKYYESLEKEYQKLVKTM